MNYKNHWQEYKPSKEDPWDLAKAAHLYRRAGFGASYGELQSAVDRGPGKAIDFLLATPGQDAERQFLILEKQIRSGGSLEQMSNYWLYRMAKSDAQLQEKATLFWHGHFATSAAKVDEVGLMLDQNTLLRRNALKKFGPMVQEISKDPAMLIYLDSKVNRKTRPNENYARELMELFCLGLGNYTEDDIKQVARSFTGWEVRNDRFKFNKYQHDYGSKSFLGHTGEFTGEEAVEIVLGQKSSAEFIASKLINFFVTDLPVPDGQVVELAAILRNHDFDISQGIRTILSSSLFYKSIGQKIKSPVELGIGLLRSLEASTNFVQLSKRLDELGQRPFYPPNVKGWPGGRTWINSATLLGRINLVSEMLTNDKTKFEHGSLSDLTQHYEVKGGPSTLEFLETLLLAKPVPKKIRPGIVDIVEGRGSSDDRLRQAIVAIASLPEFQLS